jgi:hypothetical protein
VRVTVGGEAAKLELSRGTELWRIEGP